MRVCPPFGFLNFHKPLHWTSHDCVAFIRRSLRERTVGHGGTLDPLATGVLPIAVGKATRLLPYLPKEKQYFAQVRLGQRTETDDLAGAVLTEQDASAVTLATVEALLPEFLGQIQQIPPKYSAIQVNGKRLYELARAGIECPVPCRQVEVHSLTLSDWQPGAQPEFSLTVICGEGTYIRALARDIGDRLGVGATLAGLVRQRSGGMAIEQSVTTADLEQYLVNHTPIPFLPVSQVLTHYPTISLDNPTTQRWHQGQRLRLPELPLGLAQVQTEMGQSLGMGEVTSEPEGTVLRPRVVLPLAVRDSLSD